MSIDTYYRVLDKGFIALKEVMGNDFTIEQAARTSYGKGTRKVSETRGLLRYLMRNKHTTPYEMCEFKFHIKVPMDCWRQWIRHRTANVNEYSTRYSVAIDDKQTTQPNEWRIQSGSNKQGSSGLIEEWPEDYNEKFRREVLSVFGDFKTPGELLSYREELFHNEARKLYEERLHFDMAREQARKDLPLSNYTIAYWKCDLHNIFHFLRLRCDSHAQKEIRDYAMVMASLVKEHCPLAFEAWYDYSFGAVNFTRLDRKLLVHEFKINELLITNADVDNPIQTLEEYAEEIGMSKREFTEYEQKTQVPEEVDFNLDNLEVVDVSEEQ